MASNIAKVHSQQSQRARRGNPGDADRKVVFKSVLDNPFRIQWPSVPANVQNGLLAAVLSLLDGVAEYHVNRPSKSRKRKREEKEKDNTASKKSKADTATQCSAEAMNIDEQPTTDDVKRPAPAILKHITMGINQVTKELESQIKAARLSSSPPPLDEQGAPPEPTTRRLKLVLVCRADVDPPILIDHIPHLVAAYNSTIQTRPNIDRGTTTTHSLVVKLGTLPKRSELLLAEAMGLRRVSVLAIDNDHETIAKFHSLLDVLPVLTAPWLSTPGLHVPTHIKQLQTTAPKDMKKTKEQRLQGRAQAKQKNRASKGA